MIYIFLLKGGYQMGFYVRIGNVKFLQIDGQIWADTPHYHTNDYQISIPLNGKLFYKSDNKEILLIEGNSMVANPFTTHEHQIGPQRSSFIIVGFNRIALNQWANEKYRLYEEIEFRENQILFSNDFKEQMKKWLIPTLFQETQDNILQAQLEDRIFSYFLSTLKGSHAFKDLNNYIVSDKYINNVLEYIHSFYYEEIKIEDLALVAQQSKYHFIRSFKHFTGYTPYQYLITLRIEKAKDLLKYTNKSITEISYKLGFTSLTQFQRNFIRIVGYSPKKFRENI